MIIGPSLLCFLKLANKWSLAPSLLFLPNKPLIVDPLSSCHHLAKWPSACLLVFLFCCSATTKVPSPVFGAKQPSVGYCPFLLAKCIFAGPLSSFVPFLPHKQSIIGPLSSCHQLDSPSYLFVGVEYKGDSFLLPLPTINW